MFQALVLSTKVNLACKSIKQIVRVEDNLWRKLLLINMQSIIVLGDCRLQKKECSFCKKNSD